MSATVASNSDASSNASSPPSSVHMPANNQIINNNNNAPKYGTLVPNRVFVGGIPSNTSESELCQLFSKYGNVKATKIISDRAGVSKGYGFVTFETEEEAKRLQSDADNIVLRERRLNIAPAVKKQPFSRVYENTTSSPPATPSLYYHNGMPYTFHNGMAYFPQAPNQGAAAIPTSDLPTVFQGSGFGPQSNSQSFGPAVVYPCSPNPAAMFISPQPYSPYPHMPVPAQAPPPLMYTGGPSPSTNQAANNTPENTQSVQMTAGPPTPYYVPPAMTQTPEIYYNIQPAPTQGCYGSMVAVAASHDGIVHYCDVPIEQGGTSISPEDAYAIQTPERPLSNALSVPQTENKNSVESNVRGPHYKGPENRETPVVSLLNLHDDESHNANDAITFSGGNRPPRYGWSAANRQYHTGVTYNRSYQQSNSTEHETTVPNKGYNGRGRGSMRGRAGKYNQPRDANSRMSTPTPTHDDNNNQNYTEKFENRSYRTDIAVRGVNPSFRGGRGRGFNRGSRNGGANPSSKFSSPSLPPPHANVNCTYPRPSHPNPYSHPNFKGRSLQVQQQVFHQRTFPNPFYPHYTVHQQAPLPPPPSMPLAQPRRYANGGKKPTNGSANVHLNSRKMKAVEGLDSGAAGDGPVPNMVSHSPPASPGTNKASAVSNATELCTHIQAMNL